MNLQRLGKSVKQKERAQIEAEVSDLEERLTSFTKDLSTLFASCSGFGERFQLGERAADLDAMLHACHEQSLAFNRGGAKKSSHPEAGREKMILPYLTGLRESVTKLGKSFTHENRDDNRFRTFAALFREANAIEVAAAEVAQKIFGLNTVQASRVIDVCDALCQTMYDYKAAFGHLDKTYQSFIEKQCAIEESNPEDRKRMVAREVIRAEFACGVACLYKLKSFIDPSVQGGKKEDVSDSGLTVIAAFLKDLRASECSEVIHLPPLEEAVIAQIQSESGDPFSSFNNIHTVSRRRLSVALRRVRAAAFGGSSSQTDEFERELATYAGKAGSSIASQLEMRIPGSDMSRRSMWNIFNMPTLSQFAAIGLYGDRSWVQSMAADYTPFEVERRVGEISKFFMELGRLATNISATFSPPAKISSFEKAVLINPAMWVKAHINTEQPPLPLTGGEFDRRMERSREALEMLKEACSGKDGVKIYSELILNSSALPLLPGWAEKIMERLRIIAHKKID